MDPITIYVIIGAAVLLLALFIFTAYVKAPPSFAFIISGLSKEPRVLIHRFWRIPHTLPGATR